MDVAVQKHLSSSLVDVDIHPTYVSIVIKSKVLRLRLPAEVKATESVAQRSITTGNLLVSMPKIDPEENMLQIRAYTKAKEREVEERSRNSQNNKMSGKTVLASDMLQDAEKMLKKSVCIEGIVDKKHWGVGQPPKRHDLDMKVFSTQWNAQKVTTGRILKGEGSSIFESTNDEDAPPPLF